MTDRTADIARAVARLLSDEYGPTLAVEVEAELHSLKRGQYVDPIAVASLIVSVATLAWTMYTDLKKTAAKVQADVLARSVRVTLRDKGGPLTPGQERVVNAVVGETLNYDPHKMAAQ